MLLPSFEKVKGDKVLYAHASRILHHETNLCCARALMQNTVTAMCGSTRLLSRFLPKRWTAFCAAVQARATSGLWQCPYSGLRNDPFSVNIMRGCFGGCSFCSITEHEGRIIQSRSEDSIINEIEAIRDTVPGLRA